LTNRPIRPTRSIRYPQYSDAEFLARASMLRLKNRMREAAYRVLVLRTPAVEVARALKVSVQAISATIARLHAADPAGLGYAAGHRLTELRVDVPRPMVEDVRHIVLLYIRATPQLRRKMLAALTDFSEPVLHVTYYERPTKRRTKKKAPDRDGSTES